MKENVRAGYGFVWRYAFNTADIDEVKKRVRDGLVPLLGSLPGFVSYGAIDAGGSNAVSFSLRGS